MDVEERPGPSSVDSPRAETDLRQSTSILGSRCRKMVFHKAKQLARAPGYTASDQKDLEQELTLELLKKHNDFDSSRAAEETFFSRVINSTGNSLVRHNFRKMRDVGRNSVSLNDFVSASDGGRIERAATFDATANTRHRRAISRDDTDLACLVQDIAFALEKLPPELRKLAYLLKSMPKAAASRVLQKSRQRLDKDISIIHECFQEHGIDGYL